MNSRTKWLKGAAQLCADPGPDDGVDPRILARQNENQHASYKCLQLCKEAKRIILLVMDGEIADPIIKGLCVLDVGSGRDGQFLIVTVGRVETDEKCDEALILGALVRVSGRLRGAIAQGINRKRVPNLRFKYAGVIDEGITRCQF